MSGKFWQLFWKTGVLDMGLRLIGIDTEIASYEVWNDLIADSTDHVSNEDNCANTRIAVGMTRILFVAFAVVVEGLPCHADNTQEEDEIV